MIKNNFYFLIFLFTTHSWQIFSMLGNPMLCYQMFVACKEGDIEAIKKIRNVNPMLDINDQDYLGFTFVLHAATNGKWDVVLYLLEECGADKALADNFGQTVFSKAVYWKYPLISNPFKKLLAMYTPIELNSLCKKIDFARDFRGDVMPQFSGFVLDVINQKRDLHSKNEKGNTALHEACIYAYIPYIIQLLNRGASLEIKNEQQHTPYEELTGAFFSQMARTAPLFVVREAFNNGSLLRREALIEEIGFVSPKAHIWKPVCREACRVAGIEETDETRCLIAVLKMSQSRLTEVNKLLALEDK